MLVDGGLRPISPPPLIIVFSDMSMASTKHIGEMMFRRMASAIIAVWRLTLSLNMAFDKRFTTVQVLHGVPGRLPLPFDHGQLKAKIEALSVQGLVRDGLSMHPL